MKWLGVGLSMALLVLVYSMTLLKAQNTNSLELSSRVIKEGKEIPPKYTCEELDMSPPLEWLHVPEKTKSLALIMEDPDASDKTWVHWVIYNIPPEVTHLTANLKTLPSGSKWGVNSWGKKAYGGPCPPKGRHRYYFRLYALDKALDIKNPTKDELLKAMKGHIIARDELMATYKKNN